MKKREPRAFQILLLILLFSFLPLKAQDTVRVLVAYYSETGHTARMAREVAKGAAAISGVIVRCLSVEKISQKQIIESDAIVVGSPVYNANVAPQVQQFINRWPFEKKVMKNKIGAAFATGGGISAGEELVQLNLLHSMLIFGMIVVGGGEWQQAFGASAITAQKPFNGDTVAHDFLLKAYHLGKRVAQIAKIFKRGKEN